MLEISGDLGDCWKSAHLVLPDAFRKYPIAPVVPVQMAKIATKLFNLMSSSSEHPEGQIDASENVDSVYETSDQHQAGPNYRTTEQPNSRTSEQPNKRTSERPNKQHV
eukprot:1018714-Amorphochlora_amoeboformis.AAC.1